MKEAILSIVLGGRERATCLVLNSHPALPAVEHPIRELDKVINFGNFG